MVEADAQMMRKDSNGPKAGPGPKFPAEYSPYLVYPADPMNPANPMDSESPELLMDEVLQRQRPRRKIPALAWKEVKTPPESKGRRLGENSFVRVVGPTLTHPME